MIVSPSKILTKKVYKGRTLNFETVRRTHDNLVVIAAKDRDEMLQVLNSTLFRPNQLMSVYAPRIFKAMDTKVQRIEQKEYYREVRDKTKNRVRIGKISADAYGGMNLAYDISTMFEATEKYTEGRKSGLVKSNYLTDYLFRIMDQAIKETQYSTNYLIFPITEPIERLREKTIMDFSNNDPIVLFLRAIRREEVNLEVLNKFDAIFFYNPIEDLLYRFDMEQVENFAYTYTRVAKLNSFPGFKEDDVEEEVDIIEGDEDLDEEDKIENTREKIKEKVFNDISRKIRAKKLDDYQATTKEEKDIVQVIDKKVDNFLSKEENKDKTFDDLVSEVEKDDEVKISAIKYVETKRVAQNKSLKLADNLEKELESIEKIDQIVDIDTKVEPKVFKPKVLEDPRIKESKLANLDAEYNKKQLNKDFSRVLSGFSNSSYLPMTLHDVEIEDTSDNFKEVNTVKVAYKTDEGKILRATIDVPKMVDDKYFYLAGNKKTLVKQLIRLPIVKTKVDRVEITTNYNKVTIERTNGKLSRKNAYLLKLFEKFKTHPHIDIVEGSNDAINTNYQNDFEYEELGSSISYIESPGYHLIFNRSDLEEEIDMRKFNKDLLTKDITPVGFDKRDNDALIVLKEHKLYKLRQGENKLIGFMGERNTLFDLIYFEVLGLTDSTRLPTIGKSFVYTRVKIFGETYPMFVILGLMNGMTDILRRYNVKYYLTDKKQKARADYVEVRFKDKYLYYEGSIKNTILLNVLYMMDTEEYNFSDFDLDKPYLDFFINKLDQPLYIKDTLRINLNVMLDPITQEVLKELKLPRDIIDLFLLANTMLTTNAYRPQNDIRNYRVRGNEIVPSILYEIIASAYVKYQRAKLNGRNIDSLDIPRNALISRLLTEPNINDHSTLNPVLEMENIASISAKGFRGINLNQAYTLEVRSYDESMVGILAGNATPFGPNSGVNRALSYNPKIESVRGYIPDIEDRDNLEPTEILSPAELLSAFTSTHADPPRQAMQISQTKHTMPVKTTHKQLVGSGINKTMAFMISDDFAFKAKESGFVESIDKDGSKIAILQYDSGRKDAIDLAEVFSKNSNSGFYIKQEFVMPYKEKDRFEKGDVIAYNPSFFSGKGKDIDYHPGTLSKVAIAPTDLSYEDSSVISETLAEKTASRVTMLRQVALGPNTEIHKMVKVGDSIKIGEPLLDFTTSFDDPTTAEFLSQIAFSLGDEAADLIGNEQIKSHYTGTVVDIKVYYNREEDELSPSLKSLIKKYRAQVEKRRNTLSGVKSQSVRVLPVEKQNSEKVGITKYDGVLIEFYIEYFDPMSSGDKFTYNTALKAIVSKVIAKEESPISEYRPEENVEGILTPTGIISRMTGDIYLQLYSNKVLIEVGKRIREIMDDER